MARSNSAKNAKNNKISENDLTLSMINNNLRESSPLRNKNDKNNVNKSPRESQTLRDKY